MNIIFLLHETEIWKPNKKYYTTCYLHQHNYFILSIYSYNKDNSIYPKNRS